jgi:hypothetical protein
MKLSTEEQLELPEPQQPKHNTLISLAQEAMQLSQAILEAGGELTPEVEAALTANTQALVTKLDGYVYIQDRLEMEAAHWKTRAEQCMSVSRTYSSARERLRESVKRVMIEMDQTDLRGSEHRFKLVKSKPRLVINEAEIPAEYQMQVTTMVPDKERIREDLEMGATIPGARFEESFRLTDYVNKKGD